MKSKRFIVYLVIFFVGIIPNYLKAQYNQDIDYGVHPADYERIGQSGWQFLKLPTNARHAGMGGIITAIGYGDAGNSLTNPASASEVRSVELMANYTQWFADINYNAAAIVKNFGEWGNIGFHYIYLDYGEMVRNEYNEITVDGLGTGQTEILTDLGTFSAYDLALGLTYARQITDRLQVGGNFRYIEEKIDDARISNWAIDVGTMYYTGLKTLRIAMVGRNFGPDVQFADWDERIQLQPADVRMPMVFCLGAAIDLLEGQNGNPHLWTLAGEFLHPNDGPEKVNLGTEYSYQDFVSLRAGYRFNYDEESLTLGAGINVFTSSLRFKVDYSFWDFGILGNINMFSIVLGF